MKVEIAYNGWSEITTKKIEVTNYCKDNTHFNQTVEQWVATNKGLNLYKRRKTCNCCHKPWSKLTGNIHFIMTNKGNKIICDKCFDDIGGNQCP